MTEPAPVVLVIDDEIQIRRFLRAGLELDGFVVQEAETGGEALALLSREPVDIVVLDVGLPDMSGFEVCERIKTDPAFGQPVIHLSATSVRAVDRAVWRSNRARRGHMRAIRPAAVRWRAGRVSRPECVRHIRGHSGPRRHFGKF